MINYKVICKIKFLIILIFIFQASILAAYSAENFFVTQSGAGLHNGLSTGNAFSVSDFNSSANWGIGTGKISGGDTVYLNGSITTGLTMQGSGSSGSVITIDGTNATLSGRFTITGRSYFTLSNLSFPNYTTNYPIVLEGASYGTLDGITMTNLALHGVKLSYSGELKTHDLIFSNWNVDTTNDYLGDVQRDIFRGCGYNLTIEKSSFEMKWQGYATSPNSAHNDIFQVWGMPNDPSCPNPSNMTFRYNKFVHNIPATKTIHSSIIMEYLSGNNYIYENLFIQKGAIGGSNIIVLPKNTPSSNTYINNNTFENNSPTEYSVLNLTEWSSGSTLYLKNNIIYHNSSEGAILWRQVPGSPTIVHENNIYYGGGATSYFGQSCMNWKNASESCKNAYEYAGSKPPAAPIILGIN